LVLQSRIGRRIGWDEHGTETGFKGNARRPLLWASIQYSRARIVRDAISPSKLVLGGLRLVGFGQPCLFANASSFALGLEKPSPGSMVIGTRICMIFAHSNTLNAV
jgi:hypothetical protein